MDLGHGYTGQHRAMGNTSRALLANKDGYKSWAKFENSNTELVGIYVSNLARKIADVEKLSKSDGGRRRVSTVVTT